MPQPLTFPIRGDKVAQVVSVEREIHSRQTPFQRIDIVDTTVYGRTLLLDGHIQLTEFDERAYHESLVQIPLLSIPTPKSALVVGGGDGGVIRELARHGSIKRIDMVEIDAGVIEACREFMPSLSDGAFDDPRVNLTVGDAFPFVKAADRKYDLIVVDSTDTYEDEEDNLSEQLFTEEFYTDCRNALAPGGFVVTQADNHVYCPYSMEAILEQFGRVFPRVGHYQGLVPSFGGFSAFVWASVDGEVSAKFPAERAAGLDLRYVNAATYGLAFGTLSFS